MKKHKYKSTTPRWAIATVVVGLAVVLVLAGFEAGYGAGRLSIRFERLEARAAH